MAFSSSFLNINNNQYFNVLDTARKLLINENINILESHKEITDCLTFDYTKRNSNFIYINAKIVFSDKQFKLINDFFFTGKINTFIDQNKCINFIKKTDLLNINHYLT